MAEETGYAEILLKTFMKKWAKNETTEVTEKLLGEYLNTLS